MTAILEAPLIWDGEAFQEGWQVVVEGSRIQETGPLNLAPTHALENRALLPGFVNAHSHSFQRGLRGFGESFPQGQGSFWSWRDAMYHLVETLDEETCFELTRMAYDEMLAAGITSVGEFHYLHHSSRGEDYALDRAILRAARETGMRLVLLSVYYRTGSVGQPLEGAQRRFATNSVADYWRHLDYLGSLLGPRQSLGVVAHSLRGVPLEDLVELYQGARARDLVFHLHLEEQRKEIEDCIAAYGAGPMALLLDRLPRCEDLVAVHCTHTKVEALREFALRGGQACICPLTEANLGDGIPALAEVPEAWDNLSLGTDSNNRISMLEEMRWLEYGQRLRTENRGLLVNGQARVAPRLLQIATQGGANALGLTSGIQAGSEAEFVTIDLSHGSLKSWSRDNLPEMLCFGGDERILETLVF